MQRSPDRPGTASRGSIVRFAAGLKRKPRPPAVRGAPGQRRIGGRWALAPPGNARAVIGSRPRRAVPLVAPPQAGDQCQSLDDRHATRLSLRGEPWHRWRKPWEDPSLSPRALVYPIPHFFEARAGDPVAWASWSSRPVDRRRATPFRSFYCSTVLLLACSRTLSPDGASGLGGGPRSSCASGSPATRTGRASCRSLSSSSPRSSRG